MSTDPASMPDLCSQRNPWVDTFRLCIRSFGHLAPHRDSIGCTWITGQELRQEWGTATGQAHDPGYRETTAPPPPPAAPPPPLPATRRERELQHQLNQERAAHKETQHQLERALALLYRHPPPAGAETK